MKRYRKKPIVVQAVIFTGENYDKIEKFVGENFLGKGFKLENDRRDYFVIRTLEGPVNCYPGEYIVKGTSGEFYPVKPKIFKQVHEEIEDE